MLKDQCKGVYTAMKTKAEVLIDFKFLAGSSEWAVGVDKAHKLKVNLYRFWVNQCLAGTFSHPL